MASGKRHLGLGSAPGVDPHSPISTNCSSAGEKGMASYGDRIPFSPPEKKRVPLGKEGGMQEGDSACAWHGTEGEACPAAAQAVPSVFRAAKSSPLHQH